MKTQISRDSFLPGQRYSGVYLQQGRMILDADWNELTDIEKQRLAAALQDAISGIGGVFAPGKSSVAGGAPRMGGLQVVADPPGSGNILIKPGNLYVEGVAAGLYAATPPRINEQPDYPITAPYTGRNLNLYADVWERTVTALEQADLMDAALHGADTASRSQTMLQVKWCADTIDPLDPARNPPIGNATLKLALRLIANSGDACDPCASQVKVDERLGNYLFRVEVHDYDPTPGARKLHLKWSRDNGAEACAVGSMAQGFSQGDWVWEFFDTRTEKLLGNHLNSPTGTWRGLIRETCTTPTLAEQPKSFVRQWDGYLVINLDSGAITDGRDRGADLTLGAIADQAHGRVNLDGTLLRINLELMELQLKIAGSSFVAGDYWLAEVREAKDESGDTVLDNALPRGVRHHYLLLGTLAVNGKLLDQGDAFRRRMAFPPLTDLRAEDVGFTDNCAKLFLGAVNVQQALDNLCAIDAGDIAYPLPNCGVNEGKSIKDFLKLKFDPDSDGKLTVQAALDTLLCLLNAGSLPYALPACASSPNVGALLSLGAADNSVAKVLDALLCNFKADDLPLDKADPTLCSDLKAGEIVTVQDALSYLCEKRPSCVVSVEVGQLQDLLFAFAAHPEELDIWLCLQPGVHVIEKGLSVLGKRSIRLSALGTAGAIIQFSAAPALLQASELGLEGVNCQFASTARLNLRGDRIVASRCVFSRRANQSNLPPMVLLDAWHDAAELTWRDNLMSDTWSMPASATGVLVAADTVGDVGLASAFADLLNNRDYIENPPLFDKKIVEIAGMIAALPPATKKAWLDAASPSRAPRRKAKGAAARAPTTTLETAFRLTKFTPSAPTLATAQPLFATAMNSVIAAGNDATAVQGYLAGDIVALLFDQGFGVALALAKNSLSGCLADNQIDGEVELKNGLANNGFDPRDDKLLSNSHPGLNLSGSLSLSGNRIQRLWARLPTGSINASGTWVMKSNGYESLALTGNELSGYGHSVVAGLLTASGNRILNGNPTGPTPVGKFFVNNGALSGNAASFADEFTPLLVAGNLVEAAGNVLLVDKV